MLPKNVARPAGAADVVTPGSPVTKEPRAEVSDLYPHSTFIVFTKQKRSLKKLDKVQLQFAGVPVEWYEVNKP